MTEGEAVPRRAGGIMKTARRIAVALTISVAGGLLLVSFWKGPVSTLFLLTTILGLSATAAFALFEVWPRRLPRWVRRWVLQVVAVGVRSEEHTSELQSLAYL